MRSRNQEMEACRKTFKLAKTDLYDKDGRVNIPFCAVLLIYLKRTRKHGLYELIKNVCALLDTPNEAIRQTVIETLGSIGLQIPEFK